MDVDDPFTISLELSFSDSLRAGVFSALMTEPLRQLRFVFLCKITSLSCRSCPCFSFFCSCYPVRRCIAALEGRLSVICSHSLGRTLSLPIIGRGLCLILSFSLARWVGMVLTAFVSFLCLMVLLGLVLTVPLIPLLSSPVFGIGFPSCLTIARYSAV